MNANFVTKTVNLNGDFTDVKFTVVACTLYEFFYSTENIYFVARTVNTIVRLASFVFFVCGNIYYSVRTFHTDENTQALCSSAACAIYTYYTTNLRTHAYANKLYAMMD